MFSADLVLKGYKSTPKLFWFILCLCICPFNQHVFVPCVSILFSVVKYFVYFMPASDHARPSRIMKFTCDIELIMYRLEGLELTKSNT